MQVSTPNPIVAPVLQGLNHLQGLEGSSVYVFIQSFPGLKSVPTKLATSTICKDGFMVKRAVYYSTRLRNHQCILPCPPNTPKIVTTFGYYLPLGSNSNKSPRGKRQQNLLSVPTLLCIFHAL